MRGLVLLALVSCGPPPPPTLTRVQSEVFNASCNFSSCHSGPGNNGLNLESPSHDKLVNVTAKGVDGGTVLLVVPGKPDESYLYEKFAKTMPRAGVRMPNTGDALEQARIDLVKAWIAEGAQNN